MVCTCTPRCGVHRCTPHVVCTCTPHCGVHRCPPHCGVHRCTPRCGVHRCTPCHGVHRCTPHGAHHAMVYTGAHNAMVYTMLWCTQAHHVVCTCTQRRGVLFTQFSFQSHVTTHLNESEGSIPSNLPDPQRNCEILPKIPLPFKEQSC